MNDLIVTALKTSVFKPLIDNSCVPKINATVSGVDSDLNVTFSVDAQRLVSAQYEILKYMIRKPYEAYSKKAISSFKVRYHNDEWGFKIKLNRKNDTTNEYVSERIVKNARAITLIWPNRVVHHLETDVTTYDYEKLIRKLVNSLMPFGLFETYNGGLQMVKAEIEAYKYEPMMSHIVGKIFKTKGENYLYVDVLQLHEALYALKKNSLHDWFYVQLVTDMAGRLFFRLSDDPRLPISVTTLTGSIVNISDAETYIENHGSNSDIGLSVVGTNHVVIARKDFFKPKRRKL